MNTLDRVHFLHIAKTGGTALVWALNRYNYCVQSPRRSRSGLPDIYELAPVPDGQAPIIYVHPHDENLRDVPHGEEVFFFLRDPISRFVSGFYSRQRHGRPRYNSAWSEDEKTAFERFQTANELGVALSSTDAQEKAAAEKALRTINLVKISYWEWFESEEYFRSRLADIFFVGFQEHLAEDFERLKSKLGLPTAVELPVDRVLAHKNPEHIDTTLNDVALSNLRAWFSDEFRFVELCKALLSSEVLTCR